MKLLSITFKNVQNIEELTIEPGKVTQVVGKNKQGKTSIITGTRFLMEGSMYRTIIRLGQDEAMVIGRWDNELVVTRTLRLSDTGHTKQTTKVEIDGLEAPKAQEYLNKMLGVGSFDPREILDPKKRTKFIMDMIDVKVTEEDIKQILGGLNVPIPQINFNTNALEAIETIEKVYYSNRTERNRDAKEALNNFQHAAKLLVTPVAKQLVETDQEIEDRLAELRIEYKGLADKEKAWKERSQASVKQQFMVVKSKERVAQVEAELKAVRDQLDADVRLEETLTAAVGEQPNIATLSTAINFKGDELKAEQERRRLIKAHELQKTTVDQLEKTSKAAEERAVALDKAVAIMRSEAKEFVMKKANIPVSGLTYEDGEFRVDGKSIDRLSGSEALLVGLKLTQKKNPHTNMICIDAAECMDEETYQSLQAEIAQDGFHYFVTKVGKAFPSTTDKVIEMRGGKSA